LREAGRREVREECGLDVTVGEVAEVFESIVPDAAGKTRFHYVIIDFLADYAGGDLKAGSDIQDARWVTRDDLPSYDITERAREVLTRVLSKR
jgi:ADP-ribose pyrophosphatase YjhB (NUDIX family)